MRRTVPGMTSRVRLGSAALVLTALVGLSACGSGRPNGSDAATTTAPPTTAAAMTTTTGAVPPTTIPVDIVATALTAGVFTELAGLVTDAGLVDTLRGTGPFTVFAPTDDAFGKLPLATLHAVQDDPKLLATVLTYHVVAGKLTVADLRTIADGAGTVKTVAGIDLKITREGHEVLVNGFRIAAGDVMASNGVIHVMGDVLVPPSN